MASRLTIRNSVAIPAVVILPTVSPLPMPINQRFPSGPAVIPEGFAIGTLNSVIAFPASATASAAASLGCVASSSLMYPLRRRWVGSRRPARRRARGAVPWRRRRQRRRWARIPRMCRSRGRRRCRSAAPVRRGTRAGDLLARNACANGGSSVGRIERLAGRSTAGGDEAHAREAGGENEEETDRKEALRSKHAGVLRSPIEMTGPSRRDGPSNSTRHEMGEV